MHIKKHDEINADFLRYMILNSIRSHVMKRVKNSGYGDLVIACDSRNNWRKEVFPYYKASRKTDRDNSTIDWEKVFESFNTVREELKEYFPYTVIDVERAEADDIIATLCGYGEKTLILSGDTDFVQLHDMMVEQYDPVRKKKVQINNTELYLKQHILEGDKSDGIPNILSDDDTFVLKKRQKPLTKKRMDILLSIHPNGYSPTEKRNYQRNMQLIDLTYIPEDIKLNIKEQYDNRPTKNKSKLFNYFYDRKLTKFMDSLQEF